MITFLKFALPFSAFLTISQFQTFSPNNTILDTILYWFFYIFFPSPGFFADLFNRFSAILVPKLPFASVFKVLGDFANISNVHDGDSSVFDFSFNLPAFNFGAQDIIGDTSVTLNLAQYLDSAILIIRNIFTGFIIVLLIRYNYNQFLYLVRGSVPDTSSKGDS